MHGALECESNALHYVATMLLQPTCKVVGSCTVMRQCEVNILAGCCSCCLPSAPNQCTAAQAMSAVNVLQDVGQQVRWQLPLPGLAPAVVVVMKAVLLQVGAGDVGMILLFGRDFLQSAYTAHGTVNIT
jgi:hypothetical protein